MVSEAQKRADRESKKKNTKLFPVRFYQSEADIWEYLQKQENKAGYIKGLIAEDMKNNSK